VNGKNLHQKTQHGMIFLNYDVKEMELAPHDPGEKSGELVPLSEILVL
jgi:hypothetical protein